MMSKIDVTRELSWFTNIYVKVNIVLTNWCLRLILVKLLLTMVLMLKEKLTNLLIVAYTESNFLNLDLNSLPQ